MSHSSELFIFPDGDRVRMTVFDASARPGTVRKATSPAGGEDSDPHHCPVCRSSLVYPVFWTQPAPQSWVLILRCPECETRREVLVGRAAVDRFNRELIRGARVLAHAADRLMRGNFEHEAEQIVAALERDLILPMDF